MEHGAAETYDKLDGLFFSRLAAGEPSARILWMRNVPGRKTAASNARMRLPKAG
jgi:hypothetical protein